MDNLSAANLDTEEAGLYTAMGTLTLPATLSFSAVQLVQLGWMGLGTPIGLLIYS